MLCHQLPRQHDPQQAKQLDSPIRREGKFAENWSVPFFCGLIDDGVIQIMVVNAVTNAHPSTDKD